MVDLLDPISTIKRMFEAEKFEDMIAYCQKMLENDPKNLMALQNLAIAHLHLNQFVEAINYCDIILENNENDVHALKNKIYAFENLKKHEQILPLCDKIFSQDKNDVWTLNSSGLALNELGRHTEAISYYNKSIELDPANLTALLNKANTLAFLQKYHEAIMVYDQAQKSDPSIKEISSIKSELFEKIGRHDDAFLAAQGVLVENMDKIKQDAEKNNCTVFHQFCINEFNDAEQKKQNSMTDLK